MLIKKLFFALPFFINLFLFFLQLQSYFQQPNILLSFSSASFFTTIAFAIPLVLTSICFILFCTLSYDWEIVIPTIFIGSTLPFFLIGYPANITISCGFTIVFLLLFFITKHTLRTYLTFNANTILMPEIHLLTTLLLLIAAIAFYQVSSAYITQNGFHLPPTLTQTALQFVTAATEGTKGQEMMLPSENLTTFQQNPELLDQTGLPPDLVSELQTPNGISPAAMLKDQIEKMIQPYAWIVPYVFAALFFFSLQSLIALASYPLSFVVWFMFYLLEKVGIITYVKEMREVKKLVIS